MALDTKYRPTRFDEVLGQSATVRILRGFVGSGAGLHQSYLFCGPFGSGKTTLGRILARALLCDAPVDGDPCDKCPSCRTILDSGSSIDFVEIDAATNSGKDNIRRIIEQIQYSSFSGKRRIYLFDEAHQLSRDALDALLKPMEDNIPGTTEKRLVCIFCTTEPEKMRSTVVSRCAPAFVIKHAPVSEISDRLDYVCEREGLTYDYDALELIAEHCECHIRDALKTVEGVSMLGDVTSTNVIDYLHLDSSAQVMELIADLVTGDAASANLKALELLKVQSPAVLYERLSHTAMTLYAVGLGAAKAPSWWDPDRTQVVSILGAPLVGVARRFASRPGRVTESSFLCDVATCAHEVLQPLPQLAQTDRPQIRPPGPRNTGRSDGRIYRPVEFQSSPSVVSGAYLDPRGVNKSKVVSSDEQKETSTKVRALESLSPSAFSDLVSQRLRELRSEDGSERHNNMGDT